MTGVETVAGIAVWEVFRGGLQAVGGLMVGVVASKLFNRAERKEAEMKRYAIHKMPLTCSEVDNNGCDYIATGIKGLKIHWAKNPRCLAAQLYQTDK